MRIILAEVSKRRLENYGYTAEQIVAKIERDSSVSAIVPHLLKETNHSELKRLLLEHLPASYLAEWENPEPLEHMLPAFIVCFRAAFVLADTNLRKRVTRRFVSILKEESDRAVLSHGTAFFRASDLEYVSASEVALVKEHLFARVKSNPSEELLAAMSGIGKYLSSSEVTRFVDPLVSLAIGNSPYALKARNTLEGEHRCTAVELDPKIAERLGRWEENLRQRDSHGKAGIVAEIGEVYAGGDIPF